MTQTYLCPCCKQPLPSQSRGGVYLPPAKARLYDVIAAAPGISVRDLAARTGLKTSTLKVHVSQINREWLVATDLRISGGRWGYAITERRVALNV